MAFPKLISLLALLGAALALPHDMSANPSSDAVPRALGINCRGSALCARAGWNDASDIGIMQGLRNALYSSTLNPNTVFGDYQHLVCVSQSQPVTFTLGADGSVERAGASGGVSVSMELSGNVHEGGVCLFPQGGSVTLRQARGLADKLLEHGCGTCGSVPLSYLNGSNDPADGILTFNYVQSPFCTGHCLGTK